MKMQNIALRIRIKRKSHGDCHSVNLPSICVVTPPTYDDIVRAVMKMGNIALITGIEPKSHGTCRSVNPPSVRVVTSHYIGAVMEMGNIALRAGIELKASVLTIRPPVLLDVCILSTEPGWLANSILASSSMQTTTV